MKGQLRKNRFIKRRAWGSIRSKLRARFARGNYELEPELLKPEHTLWGWDSSRMRWQFEHHHDKFAKNISVVLAYLGGMKGTEKLEHQYGLFFPRCIKCGTKCGHLRMDPHDKELYGLCGTCAQPIVNRRFKVEQDTREARSLLLARQILPPEVIKQINACGYISITSDNITYLLSYTGKIYNTTTGNDYCIHPTDWNISNWDRVIQFYILLHQKPLFVEERAHKRLQELKKWLGANTLKREVITR